MEAHHFNVTSRATQKPGYCIGKGQDLVPVSCGDTTPVDDQRLEHQDVTQRYRNKIIPLLKPLSNVITSTHTQIYRVQIENNVQHEFLKSQSGLCSLVVMLITPTGYTALALTPWSGPNLCSRTNRRLILHIHLGDSYFPLISKAT